MNTNRRFWILCLGLVLMAAAPAWAQNSMGISCPSSGTAGTIVSCTLSLSLGSTVTADAFTFGLQVVPNGSAPAMTTNPGNLTFTDTLGLTTGNAGTKSATQSSIGVVWASFDVADGNPPLSGNIALGTVKFTVPAGAVGGQSYSVNITGADAKLGNADVPVSYPAPPAATVNVQTPAATSYTLTGPAGGALNTASTNFTVTPNGTYTGTITITPSGGGLSTATVLTFSSSSAAQTFTITPTAVGPVTLTPTNSGGLTDASAVTYDTPPAAPTIGTATAGNAQISVAFTAPGSTGGSAITSYTATCGAQTGTGTLEPSRRDGSDERDGVYVHGNDYERIRNERGLGGVELRDAPGAGDDVHADGPGGRGAECGLDEFHGDAERAIHGNDHSHSVRRRVIDGDHAHL